jgi:ketosteroid isomerase-like protein
MDQTTDLGLEIEALREKIQLLEDKEAIREVVYRYGYTADLGRYDDFVHTLTEDCVWRASGAVEPGTGRARMSVFNGRDEALSAVSGPGHTALVHSEQHLLTNLIIHVDGDTATAIGHLALTVTTRWAGAFGLGTCRMMSLAFRRVDGQWLISEIEFRETGGPYVTEMSNQSQLLSSAV